MKQTEPKLELKKPKFDLDAKNHQIPDLEKKPYYPQRPKQSNQAKNGIHES